MRLFTNLLTTLVCLGMAQLTEKKEKEIAKEDINEKFEFLKEYQYFFKENEIIVYYIFLAISLLEIFKHSNTKPNLRKLIKNFLMS